MTELRSADDLKQAQAKIARSRLMAEQHLSGARSSYEAIAQVDAPAQAHRVAHRRPNRSTLTTQG